ncbi:hypothetical protein ACR30L_07945 [Psychromonas sp. PT13]|uniref:hypothetical protein n=1 Tax=Psychromonas sp. PT13 TaxID=3439547 RepID=UPI003EBDC32E
MTKTYPNKFYHEGMQGASQTYDATAGSMINILKDCLVNGFGALSPSTLVYDAETGWAKASIPLGHSYQVDSILDVSDSDVSDYNGEHRVMQVTNNDVWFELDTVPVADSSGTVVIKIAPLGWELTHSNNDGDVCIFKPAGDLGKVSLRVDNTAFSGWYGSNYKAALMKVTMVENVTDIDNYDTIYEHRWPAGSYGSDRKWDLTGDNRMIYFAPEYGMGKEQSLFCAGYIDSIRPADEYHFVMNRLKSTVADSNENRFNGASSSYEYYTQLIRNNDYTGRVLARPYHQIEGTTNWYHLGLSTYSSDSIAMPNPVDNGFYINNQPAMVMESGSYLRGYLPIMVFPLANHSTYSRKNLQNLPEFPGKIFRMLRATYDDRSDYSAALIGFDISTVEV